MVRFPATPSVAFALVSPHIWKENILKHFYGMHTHMRDAVPSCRSFILELYIGLPKSFQTFSTVLALSSHIILYNSDEKQLLKFWDSTLASFVSYSLCLSTDSFFPLPVSLMFPSLAYLPYDKCILDHDKLCMGMIQILWGRPSFEIGIRATERFRPVLI